MKACRRPDLGRRLDTSAARTTPELRPRRRGLYLSLVGPPTAGGATRPPRRELQQMCKRAQADWQASRGVGLLHRSGGGGQVAAPKAATPVGGAHVLLRTTTEPRRAWGQAHKQGVRTKATPAFHRVID